MSAIFCRTQESRQNIIPPLGLPVQTDDACGDYYAYNGYNVTMDLLLGSAWLYSALYVSYTWRHTNLALVRLWIYWWWFNAIIVGSFKLLYLLRTTGTNWLFCYEFFGHVVLILLACFTLQAKADRTNEVVLQKMVSTGNNLFDRVMVMTLWRCRPTSRSDQSKRFMRESWASLRSSLAFQKRHGHPSELVCSEARVSFQVDGLGNIIQMFPHGLGGKLLADLFPDASLWKPITRETNSLLGKESMSKENVCGMRRRSKRKGEGVGTDEGNSADATDEGSVEDNIADVTSSPQDRVLVRCTAYTDVGRSDIERNTSAFEVVCKQYEGAGRMYYYYADFRQCGLPLNTYQQHILQWILCSLNNTQLDSIEPLRMKNSIQTHPAHRTPLPRQKFGEASNFASALAM